MKKDDMVYFRHMLDHTYQIINSVKDKEYQQFYDDPYFRTSIVHWLQTIGEAARHVSEATQKIYPTIDWSKIIGMRHPIVHDYFNINYEIVWKVATTELPLLLTTLKKIIPPEEEK